MRFCGIALLLLISAGADAEECSSKKLVFADGSTACMEQFEPLAVGGGLVPNIAGQAASSKTHAYAITASNSMCAASAAWWWDGTNDDERAIRFCEGTANRKSGRTDCRCIALIPVSGKVEMVQGEFVSVLFKHAYAIIEQLRATGYPPAPTLDRMKMGFEEREQAHYQRLGLARAPRQNSTTASDPGGLSVPSPMPEDAKARNARESAGAVKPLGDQVQPRSDSTVAARSAAPGFAQEKRDWGIAPTKTTRSGRLHAPTPVEVPGAKTVTTVELRNMLLDAVAPPILIDVLDGPPHGTIPGARWLPEAGGGVFGRSEALHFEAVLERLTGRDKTKPIMFFCWNSECWLSYNATLRAMEIGYKNVFWYRGGILAWREAGFDTLVRSEAEAR